MKIEPLDSPIVNTDELLATITKYHEDFEEKDDKLNEALLKLYKAYTEKTDEKTASKKPNGRPRLRQYDQLFQSDFDNPIFEISKEVRHVYSVILFQKEKLDKTPTIETSQSQFKQEQQNPEEKKKEEKPEKPSLTDRILGRQTMQTKEVKESNRVTMQLIKDIQKVIDDWDGYIEFHTFGMDWVDEMEQFGIEEYLKMEIIELRKRIPKLFRVIAEGRSLEMRGEKQDSKDVLMAASRLGESHRKEEFMQKAFEKA